MTVVETHAGPDHARPPRSPTPETGGPGPLLPELVAQLDRCSTEEQRMLAEALGRAREIRSDGRDLDLPALVQGNLRADLDAALASDYRELSLLKAPATTRTFPAAPRVELPRDPLPLVAPLDKVIRGRASRRDFGGEPVTLAELGTLLHYSYGIRKRIMAYNTRDFPVRYAPNAGGLQSPELYLIVNRVPGVRRGLYHYDVEGHALELLNEGNMRHAIVGMSLMQSWMAHADTVVILTTVLDRLLWKYGPRAYRYAHMDIGYVSGHLYLVSAALRLRTSAVSGFIDDAVNDLLELDGAREFVQLLMPIGRRPGVVSPSDDEVGGLHTAR